MTWSKRCWWALGWCLLACAGGAEQTSGAGGGDGSGVTSSGATGGGASEPGYSIELAPGLGGPKGRCELNWCRRNMCRYICLAVPDDEESCAQAIAAYQGIPGQNYLTSKFVESPIDCAHSYDGPLCQDEFCGTYYPYLGDECLHGDTLASATGACHYSLCVEQLCQSGCDESTEQVCDERANLLMMNESVTSSSASFVADQHCPELPSGTGGSSGSGGQGNGGTTPAVDSCGNCLTDCAGLPGCCSGEGCTCEGACMPSNCSAPYQLCCNAYFCLCRETC
jgi:hypothetical protein